MSEISIIIVAHDIGDELDRVINLVRHPVSGCPDALIVLVDMGSEDNTTDMLSSLLERHDDIEYIGLSASVSMDAAYLAGMERALSGSTVILLDPLLDDPALLSAMAVSIGGGDDLVVVTTQGARARSIAYRALASLLGLVFKVCGKGDVRLASSRYRALSHRAVSYVTKHESAALGYAGLPFISRFRRSALRQDGPPAVLRVGGGSIMDGLRKALSLASSGSRTPLRMATGLCLTAAMVSMLSSIYVSASYLFVEGIVPGWTTLSLQINAMFFLLSVALAVMSEHVLSLRAAGSPPYHVASSACSKVMRRRRPNLEAPGSKP